MKAAAPKVDWHLLSLDQLERHLADLRAVNKRPTSAFWTALRKARQEAPARASRRAVA